jgi:hypothetical protein
MNNFFHHHKYHTLKAVKFTLNNESVIALIVTNKD